MNDECRFRPDSKDKEIISRCKYRAVGGNLCRGDSKAKSRIICQKILEDDIDCRHVRNNTYIITKNEKEYVVVFCSYGKRKTKSGYTVGKEVADEVVKARKKDENWYGLFAKFDDALEIEDIIVINSADLVLATHSRSSGKGVYYDYPMNSLESNDKKMSLSDWYTSLD